MKRSASSTPPSSPLITPKSERSTELNDDYLPDSKPSIDGSPSPSPNKKSRAPASSPKKARAKPNGIASKGANITSASGEVGGWEAGWTADKKEAIVARLISLGIKSANMSDLGQEFNLTKTQLGNALQTGHKNNLRDKAAKGVRS